MDRHVLTEHDEVEARIKALWRELFDAPDLEFGADDDFFKLGASSLLAMTLVERLQAEFAVPLDLLVVLEGPTPRLLARHVGELVARRGELEEGEL